MLDAVPSTLGASFIAFDDGGEAPVARDSGKDAARGKLIFAMTFCFLFMIAEVVGGLIAGSLAIMTE
jgi:Co/Zn/Cd efflux system component